jgi:hypothetical protein
MAKIKDRVKELRWVKASELIPHPENWREHPPAQQEAMKGVLAEIGFANAVIARETPEGLQLIDGHLRQDIMPSSQKIPVLVVDVTDDEANKMLLTLDPMAGMAEPNQALLQGLLERHAFESDAVNELLEQLSINGRGLLESHQPEANPYSHIVDTPIYEPTGPQPAISELTDRSTADDLINEIKQAELPADIEAFLLDAAERHVGFIFERIANYYAHAPENIQALMERSALVIIDYDQAIANGFVRLKDDLDTAFAEDYPDA